jgi:hypothetical protein
LPQNIIEPVSRSIYARKRLYKKAKERMVHKKQYIKDSVDRYSKQLVIENYVNSVVEKKLSPRALRLKYVEMSDDIKDDKEYGISHI